MRSSIAWLGLLLSAGACHSTEAENCGDAGCEPVAMIELIDAPKHATHYQVRLSYGSAPEETVFQCSFDLPGTAPDAEDGGGLLPKRYDDPSSYLMGCKQLSGKKVLLDVIASDGGELLVLHDTPEALRISVTRGPDPIHMHSFRPKYKTVDPNGPKCGPHCRVALHSINLITDTTTDLAPPARGI